MEQLLEESPKPTKKPEPVVLRTPHDFSLVTQALEFRKEDLRKLAKKNEDEGYKREATAIAADANAIEFHVLPQFASQRELPLVTHDHLEKAIASALRRSVFTAFDGLGAKGVAITPGGIESRRDSLLKTLAARVSLYAADLAQDAFNQGVAARGQTAESLALNAIETLHPALVD